MAAAEVSPTPDPLESIGYWKPFAVSPKDDSRVALAHDTFRRLLHAWDGPRIEPRLHVVRSDRGTWAASLDDGTILLSRDALDLCLNTGRGGEDRLAFVLAHELAHQRVDDLWHRRFFRLAGAQAPEVRERLLHGLDDEAMEVAELEEKETKADKDALVLMILVGFDPVQVLEGGDFFTRWVENIWRTSCASEDADQHAREACEQASRRAVRAQAGLSRIANQAALFELGVQAYVAGRYADALRYFEVFGNDLPKAVVHNNIGLAYLGEALDIRARLVAAGHWPRPPLTYPLMLDTRLDVPDPEDVATRGASDGGDPREGLTPAQAAALRREMDALVTQAIGRFSDAAEGAPDPRAALVHLSVAYLLAGNAPLARGFMEGKYQRDHGADDLSRLVLALTAVVEGDAQRARSELEILAAQPVRRDNALVRYATVRNLATLQGDSQGARAAWVRLADGARRAGNAELFRVAVAHVKYDGPGGLPTRHGRVPGTGRVAAPVPPPKYSGDATVTELSLDGEPVRHHRFATGAHLLTDHTGAVLAAWQTLGTGTIAGISVGESADRLLKEFGVPTREVATTTGRYARYDALGVAFRIVGDQVAGWFLLHPEP